MGSIPGSERPPGEGKWQPTPVFLPENSRGQRSLAGYIPKGCTDQDMTERLGTQIAKPRIAMIRSGLDNNPCDLFPMTSSSHRTVEVFSTKILKK